MTQIRQLEHRTTFSCDDILQLIRDNDLTDTNTFLVLNGGTGTGKTASIMTKVKGELERKFNKSQSLLVVESRSLTVEQLNTEYVDKIECFEGIEVCQRLGFMHHIERNDINYDWIVIDECHGLFSEAIFAEDAEFIARWIRDNRPKDTHIIFVTANDEYFDALSHQYFPGNFNFIYLFPDFTHYVSQTYVKEMQFIKTSKVDDTILLLLKKQAEKKGIIFLKSASNVKNWFFRALSMGLQAGLMVSRANETSASLTSYQLQLAHDAAINISDGQTGLSMADFEDVVNAMRTKNGLSSIRESLNKGYLPNDLDILFVTDTMQEGVSVKSSIDYIIIEGFTEVEVRQKLGRFRGNLSLLYILFNPSAAWSQTAGKLQIFNKLQAWENENNQTALAEFYGTQMGAKFKTLFLKKDIDPETGISFYFINKPAFYNCVREFHFYNRLIENTEQAVKELYTYPLLEGEPAILNYTNDLRRFSLQEKLSVIVDKWRGVPLKGPAQDELIQDFKDANIIDEARRQVNTFRKCINFFIKFNYILETKKANKQDLLDWPDYLTKIKEEYKVLK